MEKKPKFIGYAVHVPLKNEFLKSSSEDVYFENREWATHPSLAMIFKSKKKAQKEVEKYNDGALAVKIFETENQFIVNNV